MIKETGNGRQVLAAALLDFLEDQYNKKWIVIVIQQNNSTKMMEHAQSGGVHTVIYNGTLAAAVSVNLYSSTNARQMNLSSTLAAIREFLDEFKFPVYTSDETTYLRADATSGHIRVLKPIRGAYRIHDYIDRSLTRLRITNKLIVSIETLVVQSSNCEASQEDGIFLDHCSFSWS